MFGTSYDDYGHELPGPHHETMTELLQSGVGGAVLSQHHGEGHSTSSSSQSQSQSQSHSGCLKSLSSSSRYNYKSLYTYSSNHHQAASDAMSLAHLVGSSDVDHQGSRAGDCCWSDSIDNCHNQYGGSASCGHASEWSATPHRDDDDDYHAHIQQQQHHHDASLAGLTATTTAAATAAAAAFLPVHAGHRLPYTDHATENDATAAKSEPTNTDSHTNIHAHMVPTPHSASYLDTYALYAAAAAVAQSATNHHSHHYSTDHGSSHANTYSGMAGTATATTDTTTTNDQATTAEAPASESAPLHKRRTVQLNAAAAAASMATAGILDEYAQPATLPHIHSLHSGASHNHSDGPSSTSHDASTPNFPPFAYPHAHMYHMYHDHWGTTPLGTVNEDGSVTYIGYDHVMYRPDLFGYDQAYEHHMAQYQTQLADLGALGTQKTKKKPKRKAKDASPADSKAPKTKKWGADGSEHADAAGALGLSLPGQPDEEVKRAKRQKHVGRACVHCKKAHLACDDARPCRRCAHMGRLDCVDVEHKRRGRPRNSGTKQQAAAAAAVASSQLQAQAAAFVASAHPHPHHHYANEIATASHVPSIGSVTQEQASPIPICLIPADPDPASAA
ncbi:hypothetical protein SeLEV6574_g00427 [Synchytrium endobioticum]|uniref:Zn(2)-C6 fungal-type domain-containing protein n=1 Tax=Synchytrium endobioticum TaxID=286115 RepID=A0A507DHP2_9FUNG|nr:hypothetical protein SeLEV6574_g00427 [Synchytrium endobioticum]